MGKIELQYYFKKTIDRSNDEGTCLWCGKKLRKSKRSSNHPEEKPVTFGDYGDNAFCRLRCGYSFGVVMAKHGHRLKPYTETKEVKP